MADAYKICVAILATLAPYAAVIAASIAAAMTVYRLAPRSARLMDAVISWLAGLALGGELSSTSTLGQAAMTAAVTILYIPVVKSMRALTQDKAAAWEMVRTLLRR